MRRKLILKRLFTLFLAFTLLILLCGCDANTSIPFGNSEAKRLKISASIFPQYDFVKQIAKDRVDLKMVLPAGAESHTFEPAPDDIIDINSSDLFIYTGEEMEPWAKRIISGFSSDSNIKILDLSQKIIPLIEAREAKHVNDEHDGHIHAIDPHFFTNPVFAIEAINEISTVLCELDPVNASFYKKNTDLYLEWLEKLDDNIREVVKKATRDEIVFGGRFAFRYFCEEYGIKYISAFDGCSAESDPGIARIYEIITRVLEKDIKRIYHEELTDPKTAQFIANETGGKISLMHSCHNITKEELKIGVGYLDLMKKNLENLEAGLNRWE